MGAKEVKTPVLAIGTLSAARAVVSGAVTMARRSLFPSIQ